MTAACCTAQEYGSNVRRWYFDDDMTGSWRGRAPGYLDDEAVDYLKKQDAIQGGYTEEVANRNLLNRQEEWNNIVKLAEASGLFPSYNVISRDVFGNDEYRKWAFVNLAEGTFHDANECYNDEYSMFLNDEDLSDEDCIIQDDIDRKINKLLAIKSNKKAASNNAKVIERIKQILG